MRLSLRLPLVFVFGSLVFGLAQFAPIAPTAARDWSPAPELDDPDKVRRVEVDTEAALQTAVRELKSNQLIVIAPGTYQLTHTLHIGGNAKLQNVGIRGATDDPDDVHLVGPGMTERNYGDTPHGIMLGNVDGCLIAYLTLREFWFHTITMNAQAGADRPHIYHCRLIDSGEQFIKGNTGPGPDGEPAGVDGARIEHCYIAYTTTCRGYYTAAIDIHACEDAQIRDNHIENIRSVKHADHNPGDRFTGATIRIWQGSRRAIIERNTFINCEVPIGLGWETGTTIDPNHIDGIVRNNVIYQEPGLHNSDVGIACWRAPGSKIYNNTLIMSGNWRNAIEVRYPSSKGVQIINNLIVGERGGQPVGIAERDGAEGTTIRNNVVGGDLAWFADAAERDFQLGSAAPRAVVNAGETLDDNFSDDFQGSDRPKRKWDIGAHERIR